MQRVECKCVKVDVKFVQFVPLDIKVCCVVLSLCLRKLKPLLVESEVLLAEAHFCVVVKFCLDFTKLCAQHCKDSAT